MDARVNQTTTQASSEKIVVENTYVMMNEEGQFLSCQYVNAQQTGPKGAQPAAREDQRRYLCWSDDISRAIKGKNPGKVRYCARRIAQQESVMQEDFDAMMAAGQVYRATISAHRHAPGFASSVDGVTVKIDRIQQIEQDLYVGFSRAGSMATKPSQAISMPGDAPHMRYRMTSLTLVA